MGAVKAGQRLRADVDTASAPRPDGILKLKTWRVIKRKEVKSSSLHAERSGPATPGWIKMRFCHSSSPLGDMISQFVYFIIGAAVRFRGDDSGEKRFTRRDGKTDQSH